MKLPQSYKLWARLSRFHRNLKGNYSCTEALLKEAHCLTTNIHVYKSQGTWITEGPSLEYWISDAMDAPIGSEAEIFSGDLPNEIWTMVFKNLLQHDLSSCLRVSCKVCVPYHAIRVLNMLIDFETVVV